MLILFILTVAACEVRALALAVILLLYRRSKSLDVSLWQELREADQEPIEDEGFAASLAASPWNFTHLTPSGPRSPSPKESNRRRSGHV